jgi:uncharacterized protein
MKFFKFIGLFCVTLWFIGSVTYGQYPIPKRPSKQTAVYDYAETLKKDELRDLELWLLGYADTTSTQIVVIIIPSANGENLGLLAPRWGHEWGIGQAKEDNGVILLVDMKGREIWISPGYGLEDKLPAGITGEIVRNKILPYFKEGRYAEGLRNGIQEIMERIAGTYKPGKKTTGSPWVAVAVFCILLVMVIYLVSKNKGNGPTGGPGGQRNNRNHMRSNPIFWGGMAGSTFGRSGGGSFGGGGGGFSGGFGGGGFSGGGAGGRW